MPRITCSLSGDIVAVFRPNVLNYGEVPRLVNCFLGNYVMGEIPLIRSSRRFEPLGEGKHCFLVVRERKCLGERMDRAPRYCGSQGGGECLVQSHGPWKVAGRRQT